MADHKEIDTAIESGLVFRRAPKKEQNSTTKKVKTKAKKKSYITGQHGSASAKKKAEIRRRRANRHST